MESGQTGAPYPVPSSVPFRSFPKTRLGAYAAGKLLKYPLTVKLARLGRADGE
jgi:hypothetical protein